MTNALMVSLQPELNADFPDIGAGDTVRVHQRIVEGRNTRIQVFQGDSDGFFAQEQTVDATVGHVELMAQAQHQDGGSVADGFGEDGAGTGNRIGKTDDAVGERVLAVQAKVDVRRLGHARILLRGALQQTPGGRCDAEPGVGDGAGP